MIPVLVALLLTAPAPPPAPDAPPAPAKNDQRPCVALAANETITIDLADAPLSDVARLVSCALEKNLLFQPGSLGARRVSFIGPRPLDRRDLATLWRALLADQDLVEESHGAFEVVRPARK